MPRATPLKAWCSALLVAATAHAAEEKWQTIGTGQVLVKTRPVPGSQVQELGIKTRLDKRQRRAIGHFAFHF